MGIKRLLASQRNLIATGVVVLLLCAHDALARPGVVQTRDGKTYEGQIRLDNDFLVVANVERNVLVEVTASNLLRVVFGKEAGDSASTDSSFLPEDGLPAPWLNETVGSAPLAGGAALARNIFRMTSFGTNITGARDAFRFVYKRVKGNSEILARVISLEGGSSGGGKAGLMMRDHLRPESRNIFLGVTGGRGGVFQWRAEDRQDTRVELQRDMFVPFWIKLKRDGDNFTAYKSRSGTRWSLVQKVTIPMAEEIHVGLAVAGGREDNAVVAAAEARIDFVREAPSLPRTSFIPEVRLANGSTVRGRIAAADESSIQFSGAPPAFSIPSAKVSSIYFAWLPLRFSTVMTSLRPGVLLTDGAFVDGDFKRIVDGQLLLSSVLFGLRRFDINTEIIAVNLRESVASSHRFEVTTLDGSRWLGAELAVEPNEIVVRDVSLGECRIPIYELAEVRRTN